LKKNSNEIEDDAINKLKINSVIDNLTLLDDKSKISIKISIKPDSKKSW
jgi:hypothetical protein